MVIETDHHRPDSQARELVRLVLVDGLTQADAARQLGATEQAASNALRAARATLELARVAIKTNACAAVSFDSCCAGGMAGG